LIFFFFQLKISNEKADFIYDSILENVCADRGISREKLIEIIKPREELFATRINSSADHLGENLQDLVGRVIYAYENDNISSTALAFTNNPFLKLQVFNSFQERYIEGMKSQFLKKLLEDIKTKRIKEMT
jgi:hypothetical protein